MNVFLIYDGQELSDGAQKLLSGANLTLITEEGASVPTSLLPVFAKVKSLTLLPIKNKDPFVLGFVLGQNFKLGDHIISSGKENEMISWLLGKKSEKKQRKPRQQLGRNLEAVETSTDKTEKSVEAQKEETKIEEAPGAMPKPIEENISDEKDKKFEKAFKESGISNKYKDKTLELYKIATDKTSRDILSRDIGDMAQRQKVLEFLDKVKPIK